MNSKKANWSFLITIVVYVGVIFLLAIFVPFLAGDLVLNNLICEVVLLLPILLFILASKDKLLTFFPFHKIKFTSILMIALFTFLSFPFLSLLNVTSQLWVENEVAAAMEELQIAQMPFLLVYLSIGIIAPVFEEVICRGAYYGSYRKSGSAFKAMLLSALLFALFHMNINQATYAFAMGIMAVLLVEATGSLWSSILYHGFINGTQVLLMYVMLKNDPTIYSEQAEMLTTDMLIYVIAVYLIITALTLPLAWAVLVWLGRHEGRGAELAEVWTGRKEKKDKMVTVPLVLALILCLSIMSGIFFHLIEKIMEMFV